MRSSSPSTATVLEAVDSLGPPGTPVTVTEIGAAFDCAVERLDTTLERLVNHRILKMKDVGSHRRVWWRPADRPSVSDSLAVDERQSVDRPDGGPSTSERDSGRQQAVSDSAPPIDQREHERLYSLIFNRTVQFTGVLAPDGTLLDANESALRFGGLSRAAVVGHPFWEADWWGIAAETQRRLKDAIRQAAAGETVRYEVTVQGATRTAPIDFSLRPVTDDDGAVTLLIAEGRDISDLKTHEQQLQRQRDELESELSDVLERISDGFYGLDEECRFRYINDHAETLLGIEQSTAHGCDIRETIELTDTFSTLLRQAVADQEPVFFEDYYEPLGEWFDNAIYPSETGVSVFFQDISERKRLERELRTEKEHFQVALQNSPVVAFRQDTDLRYTWVGSSHRDFSEGDILGKRDDELLDPEAAAAVIAPKRRALETGERVREEVTLDLPSGETIYDMTIEPLFDGSGDISGLTATAVDRTEQTRTKEALRNSEERLRLALQAADVGTWELDLRTEDSPVQSIEHDRIFGYEEGVDDWSFEVFLDHVHPDDRPGVERSFDDAFETGTWKFDCRIIRADGIERWICAEGEFQTDTDGEPVRAVGVVQDITDRQTRQQQLKQSEQRYRTLIKHFPNGGVALLDDELRHTIVDGLGFEQLGLDATALRGNRIADVVDDEVAERIESQYRATLDGESRTFELQIGSRTCEFRTIPLRNTDGVFAILSIFHDITLRKAQHEEALATLNQLHETVQDIAHLIGESTTQADIEQVVCDRFDATDGYLAAWIGRLDRTGRIVTPSTVGGGAVDCSALTIAVDDDDLTVAGPIARAVETGTVQRVQTSPTDPVYAQWSESTPVVHRPGVAIPIRYEAHGYGVVVVYSDRPEEFDQRELATLERLGTIIGHAINSIERKRALIADRATEVVVRSDAVAQSFIEGTDDEAITISIDQTLSLRRGRSLIYYTISGIDPDRFIEIIEGLVPDAAVRLLERVGPKSRLEHSTDAETIHSVIATHGGTITAAGLRDGEFLITIRIPHGTDVRPVLDAARTVHPDLKLVSQTTVSLPRRTPADTFAMLADGLTDRQRETLEVGYYAGFFEWPRETTGNELAELMDVTPATVHHHLRHGQQKLLAAFFEDGQPSGS
jgi:PAS domain S-box-containing protein